MRDEFLILFGDILNYLIFLFIFVSVVNTGCFNVSQQLYALIGLIATIIINMITAYLK